MGIVEQGVCDWDGGTQEMDSTGVTVSGLEVFGVGISEGSILARFLSGVRCMRLK